MRPGIHIDRKSDVDDPFSVGRDVGKPVVVLVEGDLLGMAAVGPHAPDLHRARAHGVEVDVLAVGRVLWAIVERAGRREGRLYLRVDVDGPEIAIVAGLALASTGEDELLAVRRPAVEKRVPGFG